MSKKDVLNLLRDLDRVVRDLVDYGDLVEDERERLEEVEDHADSVITWIEDNL